MSLPDVVRERIERFDRNKSSYRNPAYLEEQLRVEFLNPFFIALGWDVSNEAGYAEGYKDVVHEDRVRIHGKAKAPDYSFRIGGQRKFFVEAKKPAVNIKEDVSPAYQLRRYAWSAKLPLSILTDFEEFAVYDTRIRPQPDDPASKGRVMYIRYNEYVDRWDEIASIFSKEAILLGSFDKYAHKKERRGVAEVDDAFLEEIERWREALAVDIARRNSNLGRRSLNYAVQQTIDRIVFLRICEDRGIEPYAKLRSLSERSAIYDALLKDFRAAEDRYNSGLFHFRVEKDREGQPDELTPALDVGNEVLGSILNSLYYPESPYEFSVLSADILGQVYERFLGRVIQLDQNHEASIVDKPEVRRSGGVYYTPVFIVDDIVEKTVGKLVEGKDWKAVRKLRILDPACGSGSFLIGAYKYLLDWHLQHYVDTETETHARGRPPRIYRDGKGDWQLTTHEKKRILLDNIYGVDIDRQAVEVTKLSLLLKMLEGESGESLDNQLKFFQERVLPDLSNNVRSGNSLIETDYFEGRPKEIFDDEDYLDINAFDWSSEFPNVYSNGGFDAVIGNPPYDVVEKERGAASWPHDTLRDYVGHKALYKPALGGKLNLFRFFAVRFLDLTKENGRFGMIMPLSLLADISTARTRAHLITSSRELEADCFPQKDDRNRRIFRDAKLSTAVYTGVKDSQVGKNEAFIRIRVYPANSFRDEHTEAKIFFKDVEILDPRPCDRRTRRQAVRSIGGGSRSNKSLW